MTAMQLDLCCCLPGCDDLAADAGGPCPGCAPYTRPVGSWSSAWHPVGPGLPPGNTAHWRAFTAAARARRLADLAGPA